MSKIVKDFFRIIAFNRLKTKGVALGRKSNQVLKEADRLEMLYRLYWFDVIYKTEYYSGAILWINENYNLLIDNTKFSSELLLTFD